MTTERFVIDYWIYEDFSENGYPIFDTEYGEYNHCNYGKCQFHCFIKNEQIAIEYCKYKNLINKIEVEQNIIKKLPKHKPINFG